MYLFQFGEGWSWIVWFIIMFIFFSIYPKLMVSQIMWSLERSAKNIEWLSSDAKDFIQKRIKRSDKKIKDSLNRFYEFFVIGPVSLDPFGIVKKLEHILDVEEKRFDLFVDQIMPKADSETKANIKMGLACGITLYDLAKIVRHYVETVRKTKSMQIALILQMQLPQIERVAKSLYSGTKALTRGVPVGDGIGPLIGAKLIGRKKVIEIEKDTIAADMKIKGKDVIVVRARGPGGRVGHLDRAILKIVKKRRISKIITIDAAAKLEGEKTGSVAEGVGVAFGGSGVEKSIIEDVAVKHKIPLDSIIVKMSAEEAIMPMKKEISNSVPRVLEAIERSLEDIKDGYVVIACIGNSSGVGNTEPELGQTYKLIEEYERKIKRKEKKKKWRFFQTSTSTVDSLEQLPQI
ncbi:MAG: DUF1512 family protein [Candidatus Aenigmatarchaeota archaeon]